MHAEVGTQTVATDHDLIGGMRLGFEQSFRQFDLRFRPILELYAKRTQIARHFWDTCITEVLADEAMRFAKPETTIPASVAGYLVKAVKHRFLRLNESAVRRQRRYAAVSQEFAGEWIVGGLCSEQAVRESLGPDVSSSVSDPLRRLAGDLGTMLSAEEQSILDWLSHGQSQRQIAKWLGKPLPACEKQIQRLRRRLREETQRCIAEYPARDRTAVERFLHRAC